MYLLITRSTASGGGDELNTVTHLSTAPWIILAPIDSLYRPTTCTV